MQPQPFPVRLPILSGICAAVVGPLSAATIESSFLDEETDIVITGGTVVSAVHFQVSGSGDPDPLVVNGIPHSVGTGSDTTLTINTSFEGDFRNGASGLPQDGSSIIQVLLSGIAGAGAINMEVSGLTVGQEYLFQAYWEHNTTGVILEATIEGDTKSDIVPLGLTNPGGNLISYQFVAGDDTLNASFDRVDSLGGDPNNWLSGYSLQVVPEPSVALLGALGTVCLLRRRRG